MLKSCDFVEGKTRLRSMAFAAYKMVPELVEFEYYDDWAPSKFGPMSTKFTAELEGNLGATLGKWPVRNEAGFLVDRYGLLNDGDRLAKEIAVARPNIAEKVRSVAAYYSKAPLNKIQHELYLQFPDYWLPGKIRSELVGKMGFDETSLNGRFDEVEET
jgi:hypothetical protein